MKRIEVTAPDTLREITLQQYQKFTLLEEPTEKDIIRIFLNLPDSVISKIPFKEVERVKDIVLKLFQEEASFSKRFTLNGVTFGFIPNLDDISYGEYNDLITYTASFDTMHKAMAVMYRPITKTSKGRYLIEEYAGSAKYAEVMKQAPLDVVFGAMVFFWNLGNELLNHIPNYLDKVLKKELANHSLSNTESITKYTQSLRVILDASILSPKNHYISV